MYIIVVLCIDKCKINYVYYVHVVFNTTCNSFGYYVMWY